jgi:hypothetical protein
MSRVAAPLLSVALVAFAQVALVPAALAGAHDALIAKHAALNGVPEQLIRRVIRIESRGNAGAVHAGNYGLMQIRLGTARGVGYSGDAKGLLDPDTNLTYAVKYLAGAYRAAGCDDNRAVSYYQRGYYGAALRECAESPTSLTRIAQAESKNAAKLKRDVDAARSTDAVAVKSNDVIKPKVVRTETIAPHSGVALARPVGNFEPKRVAPPVPLQPAAIMEPASLKPSEVKSDAPKLATAEPSAKFELASVPMPPARPELEPPAKRQVKPARRTARLHAHADAKAKSEPQAKADTKPDPVGAVSSFLKKLVTPDKTARKSSTEAEADPPSQVQSPQ